MAQQFGFRASRNLAEIENRNKCWDSLGINRNDLPLLVGTTNGGVANGDYLNCGGLTSNLEQQIVNLSSFASSGLTAMRAKISIDGDGGIGNIIANVVNNDRPYVDAGNTIYGPSLNSFFSPVSSFVGPIVNFSNTQAEFRLGPVSASTLTVSGVNFNGITAEWNNYFVKYKQYLRIGQEPSWTERKVPLYLAPPSSFSSNKIWLDSEFSSFVLDGNSVVQWYDVNGRGVASQATVANCPTYSGNSALNGKPAIIFDGSNDYLSFGNIGAVVPSGATLIIVASAGEPNSRGDTDFNIISTLNNTSARWRTGTGAGNFALFTSTLQTNFPKALPANGSYIWTVLASQDHGLEIRSNGNQIDFKSNAFTSNIIYNSSGDYIIGTNANASAGFFQGSIFAIALFDEVLTTAELKSVEEYFAWRYNFIYDPDRTQAIELEDGSPLETEGSVTFILG